MNFIRYVNFIISFYFFEVEKVKSVVPYYYLPKFENLQNLEKKYGFEETTLSKTFFREGKIGSWKQELNKDLSKKIEKYFEKEMRELNYL